MRRLLLVPCCLVALFPFAEQSQPQQPTFRSRLDVVAVDVHAVDGSGRPVSDLRPEEFTVTVDGKPRSIVAADYFSYPTAAIVRQQARPVFTTNRLETASSPGRWILLVVDEENIRSGYARGAAAAAARFLERAQPTDRVGLVGLGVGDIHIDPTTDRAPVRQALDRLVGRLVPFGTATYQLGLSEAFAVTNEPKRWAATVRRECAGARGPGCPDEMKALAETITADARRRMVGAVRSLLGLLDSIARLPGPKTVVFISQELPVSTYIGERADFNAEVRPLAGAAARAQATFYVVQLDRPAIDVEDKTQPINAFEDGDVRVFGLETLTTVTGGRRLMVSGKVDGAMDRIAVEMSGYYLLGFRAEAADRDGKPHAIKVAVKRPGVDLRARAMFAISPEAAKTAEAGARDVVNRLLRTSEVATDLPLSVATYVLPEPGGDSGKVRVLVTAEIDDLDGQQAPTVGYLILDGKGQNAGGVVEQVTLKPAPGDPDRRLEYLAAAVVPRGRYSIRFAAVDSVLRAGSVEHPVDATLTDAGPLALGDIVVLDRYPDESGKPRPSVRSIVSGSLQGYLEARSAAPARDVDVRLEIADDPAAPALAAGPMTAQSTATPGRLVFNGSVRLDTLPAGDYFVRAVAASGGSKVGRVVRPVHVVAEPATAAMPPAQAPPPGATPMTTAEANPPDLSSGAPARGVDELLARAGKYCAEYADQMSVIVGVERYAQWMQNEDAVRPIQKQLVSEFALVRGKDDWDGFRDVYEVDGRPVTDRRERLMKLFTESPATAVEQSRKIAAESARYNLGAMQRNFNVPTMALYFVKTENQARFKYWKDGEDRVARVAVWRIRYEETRKPTIIRTAQGRDMPVHGTLWVDPIEGRVLKTHMEIASEMVLTPNFETQTVGPVPGDRGSRVVESRPRWGNRRVKTSASITVTYAQDTNVGLLVPAEMLETYEGPYRSTFTGNETMSRVNCRATYSDFKRFETGARVVPR